MLLCLDARMTKCWLKWHWVSRIFCCPKSRPKILMNWKLLTKTHGLLDWELRAANKPPKVISSCPVLMWHGRGNFTDIRNVDLIRSECGFKCECIKSLSGRTVGHSRWQSTYAVGLSLARYTSQEYFWELAYLCWCTQELGHCILQADSYYWFVLLIVVVLCIVLSDAELE